MNINSRWYRTYAFVMRGGRALFSKAYRDSLRDYRAADYLGRRGFVVLPSKLWIDVAVNTTELDAAIRAALPIPSEQNRHQKQVQTRTQRLRESVAMVVKVMENVMAFGGGIARF